ncbi:hypothetical protein [Neolewinella litorea]|uniref:Uncharacterized protein n=1 Tax=Neolewinella litorea TaxID=2562452 RepID=A0A4S4NQS6_9BACT|nr:hypothetical protein [Neolewinella litorea]THH41527.1 hypothetical protein E4021_02735 [Neolewinella litorea]
MRWILLVFPCFLVAQSQVPLDAAYRFTDGVYLTHAALLANRPEVDWSDIRGEMVQLAQDNRLQIEDFGYKSGDRTDTPYAVALDGTLYFFVQADPRRGFHEFSGLQVVGRYSTMTYDTTVQMRRLMKAYNPATGRAFREAWVERDQRKSVTRIIDMTTGERQALDQSTVARLVVGESDLAGALDRVSPDATAKLLRALEIYNDRRPLLLPPRQANR